MLYLKSPTAVPHASVRPVNQPRKTTNCRYEWRDFWSDSQDSADQIRERFDFDREESRTDRFFLLPGRPDRITKLNHDNTFEIRTRMDEEGPLELWETTVKSKLPMRRTLARRIASIIPRFSGPVIGSLTTDELTDSLSKKSRFFEVERKREIFRRGDVTARISRMQVDGTHALSIAFESLTAEPLLAELKALGLGRRKNTNFGEFLLETP